MKFKCHFKMRLLAACFSSILITSCAAEQAQVNKPYRAEILKFIPSSTTSGESWVVAEQELATLENLDTLEGSFFSMTLGGLIKINSNIGSLIDASSNSSPVRANLRYTTKNGVIVPRDTTTLLALSSYFAFEQTLAVLKESTGIDPNELKKNINGPYRIYFEPSLTERDENESAFLTPKLNAAFNPESNDFYLFRRSELESIPFSANIKVISHEFGHALFKNSFNANNAEICRTSEEEMNARMADKFFSGRWSNEYAISGINEGFSDFNSYIVTSSTNVFTDSLPGFSSESRSLNGPAFVFSQLTNDIVCSGRFYCIGTLFARALYGVAQSYKNRSDLMAFSRRVYSALEKSRENLRASPAKDILPMPSKEAATCIRRSKLSLSYDGAITSAFLAAFLQSFSAGEEKKNLCENLKNLFGNYGFSQEARIVCES